MLAFYHAPDVLWRIGRADGGTDSKSALVQPENAGADLDHRGQVMASQEAGTMVQLVCYPASPQPAAAPMASAGSNLVPVAQKRLVIVILSLLTAPPVVVVR